MIPSPPQAMTSKAFTGVSAGCADVTEPCRQEPGSAAVEEHAGLRVHGGDQGGEHGDDAGEPGHDGRRAEVAVGHGQERDR